MANDPKRLRKVLEVGHSIRYDTIRHVGIRLDEQQADKEEEEDEDEDEEMKRNKGINMRSSL